MAKIEWESIEEVEKEQKRLPTTEELLAKIEEMEKEKKITDLALLELTEILLG